MRLAVGTRLANTFPLTALLNSLGICSNRLRTLSNLFHTNEPSLVSERLTLEKGQIVRVPSACQEIHVVSGVAWITFAGEDLILQAGEKTFFPSNKASAVLSALGNMPVILEIL